MAFHRPVAAFAIALCAAPARAQSTGEIFGKVTDESNAVLPGVTVTLTGPSLLQPQTAITAETGTFQFPRLDVGTYNVKFELAGFKTVIKEGVRVTVGLSANVSTQLGVSAVQETVTVTGESADRRHQADGHEANLHARSAAEHPIGARSVGHPAADRRHRDGPREHRRQHVGPAVELRLARRQPDQQQVVAGRRRHHRHVGDRSVAELLRLRRVPGDDDQHRRRRRDAADRRRWHQPGDQERHRSLPRLVAVLDTDQKFESNNITSDRGRRAPPRATRSRTSRTTGSRRGGPIQRGRAWIWGSFGKQTVDVGVVSFYQPTAECQAFKDSRSR